MPLAEILQAAFFLWLETCLLSDSIFFVERYSPFSRRIVFDAGHIAFCRKVYIVSPIRKALDFDSVMLEQITDFVSFIIFRFSLFQRNTGRIAGRYPCHND